MKKSSITNRQPPASTPAFTEDDIRGYAEHLYEQGGRVPGHDLDNWLEAKACLEANVPREQSHRRLHEHMNSGRSKALLAVPAHGL